jgi:superfamily II DNA/RNA helicase
VSVVDSVCERIAGNPRFETDYAAIVHESILKGAGLGGERRIEEEALRRLIQSAALFAQSSRADWRLLAYRISVGSLDYQESLGGLGDAARLTLARLGNYPAIEFAFKEDAEPATLPPSIFYEIAGRRDTNTVTIGGRRSTLTDMQKTVWDTVSSGASLALSAPTSAGKSFVFLAYIEHVKRERPQTNVVYLVPSRALISQVSCELRRAVADRAFNVAVVPIQFEASNDSTPIYVLTPERLQVLLQISDEISFDVAIVDEAHLIGEGSRGIVLHSVLQELQCRKRSMQFLFSSPQVRDPSIFGAVVGDKKVRVVKTQDSPVAQNIIFLKRDTQNNRRIEISLWTGGKEAFLSEIEAPTPIYNSADRLIYTSWVLGRGSQSLVYAEGPASCESIALKIKYLCEDPMFDSELGAGGIAEDVVLARKQLSEFAKESVHSTYVLAETVLIGVGFHYGRIPALLRNAVEESFSSGALNYIVCTSTLLQGVNLPARNIFMQNPHKGIDQPIDPVSFWNLAGRAGRLGKDFQGNVYLVDYGDWESAPLAGPKDEPVKSSLEATLIDNPAEFLEYIATSDKPSGEEPLFEAAFSKLLRDLRHERLDETLSRLSSLSPAALREVRSALEAVNQRIKVETRTLDASPQISGYRQSQLYEYMVSKINEKGPDYLIPVHPSSPWSEALNKLRPVFARVHKYLELKSGNSHKYWAPLALRWMRGDPLPKIIDDAIGYHKKQGRSKSNRTVIRDVLTDIESDLRFRYVNLLGCYIAVLKQALIDTAHPEHVERIPSLTLYLELGAASKTMIHLGSLGLSRHTASLVAGMTINKDMDDAEARAYLRRFNPESAGFSPYMVSEIRRIVAEL